MTGASDTQPATEEQMAAMDFEPWQHTPDEWKPPTNEEWARLANPYLVTVRIAWLTMHKTKEELMEATATMGEEAGHALMNNFISTINFFKGMLATLEAAEARILCAGSAYNVGVTADDDDEMPPDDPLPTIPAMPNRVSKSG